MVSAYKDEQIYTLNQRQRKTYQTSFPGCIFDTCFSWGYLRKVVRLSDDIKVCFGIESIAWCIAQGLASTGSASAALGYMS